MNLEEVLKERGILGLFFVPVCWFIGHDFNIGKKCIRCNEKKEVMM